MRADFEDGIWGYCEHSCVGPNGYRQLTPSSTNREKTYEVRATSFTSNKGLVQVQLKNTRVNQLTKLALKKLFLVGMQHEVRHTS